MANDVIFQDNSALVIRELERCVQKGLEAVGLEGVGDVQERTPTGTPESTQITGYSTNGLKQSITYKVVGNTVYIGTNKTTKNANGEEVPYPIYVELGTGKYATDGTGRKSPWMWIDKNGDAHWTVGMQPRHMFKDGVSQNLSKYERIMKEEMKSG